MNLYVFQISLAVLDIASKGYREAHDIDLFAVNTYVNGIEKEWARSLLHVCYLFGFDWKLVEKLTIVKLIQKSVLDH